VPRDNLRLSGKTAALSYRGHLYIVKRDDRFFPG